MAAGATPLRVIFERMSVERSARIRPTSWWRRGGSDCCWDGWGKMGGEHTANLVAAYIGSDCSGAYAVALVVMTMLPAVLERFMAL